jgi:AraC-like DNA-binding protein
MERARYLLETSFLSVKEIAYSVGLSDESHFVRDFKKAYGAPPTRYRMRSSGAHLNESLNEFERTARSANEQQESPNNKACH